MKFLVSFCNQYGDSSNSNLLLIDTETKEEREIEIPIPNMGIHGLFVDEGYVFAVYRSDNPGIVILNEETFEILLSCPLKEVSDPHSIVAADGKIYLASTGNDSVISYQVDLAGKKVSSVRKEWMARGSRGETDTHHVNSICHYRGSLYISAFGPKTGELWSSAKKGYIYNISKDQLVLENVYHPHSLVIRDDGVYYCDSSRRQVKKDRMTIINSESGYTRGLAVTDENIFAGSSNGRKVSKSTGLSGRKYTGNIADPGILVKNCKVRVYDRNEPYELLNEYDFTGVRNEIFDIAIIDD